MSTYVGLSDIQALPDPQLGYQFNFLVPNIPGQGGGRGLAVRCKSTSLPGQETEVAQVVLHGIELDYAGRQTYSHSQQMTLLETRDFYSRNTIRQWMDFCRNIRNASGNYASLYKANAILQLFDDTNTVTKQIQLIGCWPKALNDGQLSGEASTPVEIEVTLSYDLWTDLS